MGFPMPSTEPDGTTQNACLGIPSQARHGRQTAPRTVWRGVFNGLRGWLRAWLVHNGGKQKPAILPGGTAREGPGPEPSDDDSVSDPLFPAVAVHGAAVAAVPLPFPKSHTKTCYFETCHFNGGLDRVLGRFGGGEVIKSSTIMDEM